MSVVVAIYSVCMLSLLCILNAFGEEGNCTTGFMSRSRMDFLVNGHGNVDPEGHYGAIFPEARFICNGSLLRWVFGASWEGNSDESFTKLQIWRPTVNNGVYSKIGETTIITSLNQSHLYYYNLTTPLHFQQGDVIGYYQPRSSNSQLRLLYEERNKGQQVIYYFSCSTITKFNTINIEDGYKSDKYNLFINVITDPSHCSSGFMSVERMRLLLNLESISEVTELSGVQQIIPGMIFTCDGLITQWIVSVRIQGDNNYFPELQVWAKMNSTNYIKKNRTIINTFTENTDDIKEVISYSDFEPIPVKSGDILGIFIPKSAESGTALLFENRNSPTAYYVTTGNFDIPPYQAFNTQETMRLEVQNDNIPLITAEIVPTSPSSSRFQQTIQSTTFPSILPSIDTQPEDNLLSIILITVTLAILMCAFVMGCCTTIYLVKKRKRKTLSNSSPNASDTYQSRNEDDLLPNYSYAEVIPAGRGNSEIVFVTSEAEDGIEMDENIAYNGIQSL